MAIVRKYGWKPDLPDHRDQLYGAHPSVIKTLPSSTDLRPGCPPVYDQDRLGSCTANSCGGLFEFVMMKENPAKAFMPSRLFIYYNERAKEGTINEDSGAQIRDGIKSLATLGVCSEAMWAYDEAQFATKPPATCYTEALNHKAIIYARVSQTLTQLKGCLAEGFPFVFGFTVYESFESPEVAKTGIVSMPGRHEASLGGHAVMAVGYDDSKRAFLVRNSWGPDWAIGGYFWFPYEYLTSNNLSDDIWTIRRI